MGVISVSLPGDGQTADVADYNTPINTIVTEINGNLDNANIKSAAAIATSKLASDAGIIAAMLGTAAITPVKLMSGTGSTWSWATWTPTWTNLSVGNGTVTARYVQTGKTVDCFIRLVVGTTTSITGTVSFTLPVTAASSYASSQVSAGVLHYDDVGTAGYVGTFDILTTTTCTPHVGNASGTYTSSAPMTASVPFSFGNADFFAGTLSYEAA